MVKINTTEEKPNRFEQAANILGGEHRVWLSHLTLTFGEYETDELFYNSLEKHIAAVGDWVAKDWLRAYGIGEEAEKLRAEDSKKKPQASPPGETQFTPARKIFVHPLQEVFDAVIVQVTTGKGQRHGGGEQPFFEQPWFTTTQQVGIGFPLGQAMKKLGETSSKPDAESFETELLGAIAYAAMAYLANKKIAGKS